MKGDDDEDDQNVSIGVSRYPCMPSLVALQQMRNRLHLAHLGRKLMKWTAMATGREQRKVATDLNDVYDDFPKDIRHAFILLARCRYFYPHINTMVVESVGDKAGITIGTTTKSVSGVRVMQYELIESNHDPYAHLGLEKGGQLILETKEAWRNMLKRMIKMLQLRNSFLMLDLAHRAATKKMNVLSRIVVPRINLSIQYILSELEEASREEFFRLKRVKQNKQIKSKQNNIRKLKSEPEPNLNESIKQYLNVPENIKQGSDKSIIISDKPKFEAQKSVTTIEKAQDVSNKIISIPNKPKAESNKSVKIIEKSKDESDTIASIADQPDNEINSKSIDPEPIAKTLSTKSYELPTESKVATKEKLNTDSAIEIDDIKELGYFETKYKETIKITRSENPDGTINEEKQVITVRSETKKPRLSREMCISSHNMNGGTSCNSNRKKYTKSQETSKTSIKNSKSTQSSSNVRSTNTNEPKSSSSSKFDTTDSAHECFRVDSIKILRDDIEQFDKCTSCIVTKGIERDNHTSTSDLENKFRLEILKPDHNPCSDSKSKTEETESCVIKIISKSSMPCRLCVADDERLTKVLVEALKKVLLPQSIANDQKTTIKQPSCHVCKDPSSLSISYVSSDSYGSNKNACIALEKSFTDIIRNRFGSKAGLSSGCTNNSISDSASMKSVCCETKKSVNSINNCGGTSQKIANSSKCSENCEKKSDASTCTRKSDRFDVRSGVRRPRQFSTKYYCKDCCNSDSRIKDKNKRKKCVRNTKSLCEDDCCYFKKR